MAIRRFDIESLLPALNAGFTVLTPNNRTVDGILREVASRERSAEKPVSAWRRPAVFAIDIFIQQLWQLAASQGIEPFNNLRLLSRFDEQEIWLQIVRASYGEFPLLNSDETANSASRSYQFLKQWNVTASTAIDHYKSAPDFQTFLDWSVRFEQRCKQIDAVSLSDAGRLITAQVASLKALLPSKIALVNFDQPPPLYTDLFQAFSTACEVDWKHETPKDNQLGSVFADSKSVNQIYQNSNDEIAACLRWCQEMTEKHPHAHLGIVVDHSRSLEPLVEEAVFKTNAAGIEKDFNFSNYLNRYHSSERLNEVADFNSALSILAFNHELVDSEGFCKLLQSPKTVGASEEYSARIALEISLRKNVEAQIRLSQLRQRMLQEGRDYYCPILAGALLKFSELARGEATNQPLRRWLALFNKQLLALGWPGTGCAIQNQRLLKQWQQVMQRLATSSSVLGKLSLGAALSKLQTFLKQSNVNLDFDDRLQISLVDIEEAQDLVFDHVWMLAMDDRNCPQPINPVPFLPYGLQQTLGMPGTSTQQQLDLAVTQLTMLRSQTTGEMVVSYHALEEELIIRPSPLLKSIPFEQSISATAPEGSLAQTNIALERFQQAPHIPLQDSEQISGGTSLLSNQSNCPFRAFARNRLKASALETFSHGLNPLARGNALHKALENLGAKLGDSKTLASLSPIEADQLLAESAEIAIDYLRRTNPETMTPAFSRLEKGRLSRLMQGFLMLERQRTDFTIEHNEKSVRWQHSKLSLNLRIDRIDRLADGSLALIDYKTGKQTNYRWFDQRPDDMQLPLYQIAMSSDGDQSVSATLIWQLNAENTGLIGPMALPNFGPEIKVSSQAGKFDGGWVELQAHWNKIIYGLVEEFESGLLAVAPTRGYATCQYCDLGPLCRVAQTDLQYGQFGDEEL
ncbi:MAG: PD-(D/E)XK nuclease family protein [Pseudohongiellaceae bacterium]